MMSIHEKSFENSALARTRRERAVKFARVSFALEGISASEEAQRIRNLWVNGEISDAEFERIAGIRK